jgi:hypothetical protein
MKKTDERRRRKGLKRVHIELTIEEAAKCLTIARNKKLSRKRWLQQVIRKEINEVSD